MQHRTASHNAQMNFQQLRAVRETVRQGFNLTTVAERLHTSQPGVSRQIRELEEELGLALFERAGKRLTGLTTPGATVLPIVERMLLEHDNLRRAAADFAAEPRGTLTIATTHSQARYALPHAVRDFSTLHPQVTLRIHQGTPLQIARWLREGAADVGLASEALDSDGALLALPCYQWTHVVIAPPDHALVRLVEAGQPLTLAELARHPLITYEHGYTGRSHIDEAFAQAGLETTTALEAMDADVIKTYVELGMGVGIVAAIAHDEARDTHLRALDARHLFEPSVTRLALRRGSYLRGYVYDFITTFASPLTRQVVQAAMAA